MRAKKIKERKKVEQERRIIQKTYGKLLGEQQLVEQG